MWRLLVVGTALVVVTGCGSATSDPSSTTAAVPASATTATASITSPSTTVVPAPTSAPTTTTTIADAQILLAPAVPRDGMYFSEQLIRGLWGAVHPEAEVAIDGVQADVSDVGETAAGPRMLQWNLFKDIALEEGTNDVVFEATFADGSTLRETRTYHYDPSLQPSTGYLLELTLAIPPRVTLEFAPLEYGELGLEQTSDDTEIAEIIVAHDAVFDIIGLDDVLGPGEFDAVLDLGEFAQLAATAAREEPLEDLWWDVIFPTTLRDFWLKAAPWEFLITAEGSLQQASQLYSP